MKIMFVLSWDLNKRFEVYVIKPIFGAHLKKIGV